MNKRKYSIIFFLNILILFFPLYAQWENVRFRHLTIEDGLSQSTANCILQDRKGFIWIATEDGLNKYDGYYFEIYLPDPQNKNSLSNNSIWSLYEDTLGILWVGTYNGLNKFDLKNEKITRYMHSPDDLTSLSHKFVRSIHEDHNGALWIGTYGGGLNKFNRETGTFTHYKNNPDDPNSLSNNIVLSIYEDRSKILWIGTNDGLNRFDRINEKFTWYKRYPRNPTSLSDNTINTIYEDRSGILWIGTGNGLNRFDPSTERFTHYKNTPNNSNSLSHNDIRSIYEDPSGFLWVGTDNGLNTFDRINGKFSRIKNNPNDPNSISNNSIRSVYEDRSGVLWIGTWGGALNKFEREKKKFMHYKKIPNTINCLNDNMVCAIYEDQNGILWLGNWGGGLNKYDRRNNKFTFYKHNPKDPNSLSNNRIRAIYEDQFGMLWIGTWGGGLNSFDREKEVFTCFQYNPDDTSSLSNNNIRSILEDRYGLLWIGTDGGGLNTFDRKSKKFIRYQYDPNDHHSISSNRVFIIIEDRFGELWIATFGGGLNRYDRENNRFIHYKNDPDNPNSLVHDYIITTYNEDNSGILWIGTDGKGLCKFDREKGIYTLYAKKHGLPNNVLYGILEDNKGNLWISHNMGLSRFNPEKEVFKNFDVKDGLQSNEFNGNSCFNNKGTGEMFFGGVNGFNAFFPDSIKDNLKVPPIVITNFQIFNKPVPIGERINDRLILEKSINKTEEIELSYTDNVFSFEFAALHYVAPDKNQYAYRMEGFEKNWNYVGSSRRYATYTNLKHGTYRFKVKGSNSDGIWNEKGVSLKITITPPFWRTWWFYTLCVIAFIFSIVMIFIYQIKRIKEKKEDEAHLKVITDVGQVLEHGRATIYRRKVDSDVYDYMGNGIKDITGYDSEEFTLSTWNKNIISIDLIGEHSELTLRQALERTHEGKTNSFVADYNIHTKSGDIRWARDILTALRDKSGNCYAYLGILFDITDRKLAERELAQKRKSIQRTLFEHTPDPTVFFDKETHTFLDCNKAFQTVYGYSKDEIRSMTPFDLHPPEDIEKVKKNIDIRNVDTPYEYKHIAKDGRMLDVEILSDETVYEGKPAWISMIRNITEHKQTEQRLTQLSDELKSKNEEMEDDLMLARDVQMSLLSHNYPKNFPPNVPSEQSALQFAHRYIPASTLAGDFFEVLPISDHQVGVMIYDVMGHGVRASLFTAYLHGLIEELMPIVVDPVAFFNRLNMGINSVTKQFYAGMFATAFYCVVDLQAGMIHYANAGHPTPYVIQREKDTVKKIANSGEKSNPALGLLNTHNYTAYEYPMTAGDIVFFFTDGLYEVGKKRRKIFGEDRLLKAVKNQINKTPEMMLDGILSEVNKYAGTSEFDDDVCMVTMHIKQMSVLST